LNNSRKQLITLRDELETLELYVNLESSRFEHKFKYITNIADDIDTQKLSIPPILIQPFVENAIWHGLMQKEEGGSVILSITKSDSALQIVIEDDGIGRKKATALKSKTAQKRQSMGIEITGNRMEIIEKLYDIPCSSEIIDLFHDDGTSAGTRIVLTLPLFYDTENSNN
jgi:sensor histidine kinase YesM